MGSVGGPLNTGLGTKSRVVFVRRPGSEARSPTEGRAPLLPAREGSSPSPPEEKVSRRAGTDEGRALKVKRPCPFGPVPSGERSGMIY
jgi:hypothetical protein